jgi:hypothetical protein
MDSETEGSSTRLSSREYLDRLDSQLLGVGKEVSTILQIHSGN